jgi:hypothetical protein
MRRGTGRIGSPSAPCRSGRREHEEEVCFPRWMQRRRYSTSCRLLGRISLRWLAGIPSAAMDGRAREERSRQMASTKVVLVQAAAKRGLRSRRRRLDCRIGRACERSGTESRDQFAIEPQSESCCATGNGLDSDDSRLHIATAHKRERSVDGGGGGRWVPAQTREQPASAPEARFPGAGSRKDERSGVRNEAPSRAIAAAVSDRSSAMTPSEHQPLSVALSCSAHNSHSPFCTRVLPQTGSRQTIEDG